MHIDRVQLTSINLKLAHLCVSTQDVINVISSLQISDDDRLVTADIKDFFMEAPHSILVQQACTHSDARHLKDTLEFLLAEQYVSTPDGNVFKLSKAQAWEPRFPVICVI